jgi:type IV pilus assembly protein PilW
MYATHAMSTTRDRGYSIIELMVSIVISLIILAGLVTLFANNSRERDEIQRANQQTENGQYALEVIGDDLREAGYLGTFDPAALSTPTSDPDPCASTAANLNAAMPIFVQGYYKYNGTPTLSCLPSDVKLGSDILVVRRAGTCAVNVHDPNCTSQTTGDAYFQASGCNNASELGSGSISTYYVLDTNGASFTLHNRDCTTAAPLYPYEVHIYFVASDDKAGDGIPTLKRVDLDLSSGNSSGFSSPIPIAEGIEALKIDYGLDNPTSPTGSPTVFTADPYSYNSCSGAGCLVYWRNTVAAQVYVLARNTTQTPGYTATGAPQKTFYLGTDPSGTAQAFGPYTDGFKRHVYEAEIRLNNIAGRNTP